MSFSCIKQLALISERILTVIARVVFFFFYIVLKDIKIVLNYSNRSAADCILIKTYRRREYCNDIDIDVFSNQRDKHENGVKRDCILFFKSCEN